MKLYEIEKPALAYVVGNVKFPESTTSLISEQEDYTNTIVSGNFNCSDTKIKSLKGCPRKVGRNFNCSDTKIKSLKGCPRYTEWSFYCEDTLIVSFHDIHKHIDRIGRDLIISGEIYSHILGILKIRDLRKLGLDYLIPGNENLLYAMEIINKYLKDKPNPGNRDIHKCQEELIEAGLSRFAQL